MVYLTLLMLLLGCGFLTTNNQRDNPASTSSKCGDKQKPSQACPSGQEWMCLTLESLPVKYEWACRPPSE